MSILIKDMDMPKSCFECRFYQSDMDYCEATGTDYPFLEEVKLKDCPLVEIPTPHGRLIDCESKTFPTAYRYNTTVYAEGWNACLKAVNLAPTIIEAEE